MSRLDVARLKENGTQKLHSEIAYVPGKTAGTTTSWLSWIRHNSSMGNSIDVSYEYDANGNITCVIAWVWNQYGNDPYFGDFGEIKQTDYHYDTANQLIRENNQGAGKTWTWTYDNAGNITSRKEYAYTTGDLGAPIDTVPYAYNDSYWGDLLTAYDSTAITYDTIGNPLNDGTWTYTWRNGRELASMSNSSTTWSYTYDANGMRTSRTNGTTTYNYVYNGSQLTQMTVGNDTLYFTYGVFGPSTVTWNGTTYYYAVNAQGDVTGIFDSAGDCVVFYNLGNAWGYNPVPEGSLASTLGTLNPLRYRGYVYDQETGYYYLQSRYYDPEIGRFINADAFTSTGQGLLSNNMFAYCLNNPVSRYDPAGGASFSVCCDDQSPFASLFMYFGAGGGGIGSVVVTTAEFLLAAAVLDTISTITPARPTAILQQEQLQREEQIVIADVVTTPASNATYYGVDLRGDEWKIITLPMDYNQAVAWTYAMASFGGFGKRSKWGLYTDNQNDALAITLGLGGPGAVHHTGCTGEYQHYHVNGMILFGQYKHFHVWYGSINAGVG